MKKKTNIRTMIRQIVREEVAMAIKEVITEITKPTQQASQPKSQKNYYSKNKVLNDVLNETAQGEDWKDMGGSKFTSERMNELVGGSYGNMMNDDSDKSNGNLASSMGVDPNNAPDFLTKDYSKVMKAIDKKKGISNG